MVKFDLPVAREKIFNELLWLIFHYYLVVRGWILDFISFKVTTDKTLVWIIFSSLGLE
uniref:DUF4283 domain-containing protein n=1 Tax=Cajanus cajan TaxID=3821 RepID=A0A151RTD1_CAJCA|nr:hypothetical protein KK1_032658 [Cajanus cajan]